MTPPLPFITLFALLLAAASPAADFTPWQYTQTLPVTSPGMTTFDVPPVTLNVARAQLEDLRVISPSGVETPFVIEWPDIRPARLVDPREFAMKLIDGATELRITTGTTEPIRAVHLRAAATKFLKAARVEASADGGTWQSLVTNAVIFREPGDIESVLIKLPPQSHAQLRVIIDNKLTPPVAFSGAQLEIGATTPEEAPLPATIAKRDELKGRTRLTLDLGVRNAFVAALRVVASDAVFSRRASILMPGDGGADITSQGVGSATIFRIALGDQSSASPDIAIHRSIATKRLILEIDNGDSPPLKIEAIGVTQHPVRVLFHADAPGEWRLISGNALSAAPRYDIAAIRQQLASANAQRVTSGSLELNPQFQQPAALPEVKTDGTGIDLADSRYRKPVEVQTPGVIELTLDTDILSHAQLWLHDVRLVQAGRQVPFILDYPSEPWPGFVETKVTLAPDPKRPKTTRWSVVMPVDSLPATKLTCTSPTPLFERQMHAWTEVKDSYGNAQHLALGSARWIHKPGDATNEFTLRFDHRPVPGSFMLETDDGDNPPVEITGLRVHYPAIRLIAKVGEASPVLLYYGNERATQPSYDLHLVRDELLSAPKAGARLGPEEKLKAGRDNDQTPSAGSPWLWGALAAVVIALLWVVARMLPSPPQPPQ